MPFLFRFKKSKKGKKIKQLQKGEAPKFWALPLPHFTTINLQEKKMKNTTQTEPSAWSLAQQVPEGIDLGSPRALVTKKAPPCVMERAAQVPGWCLQPRVAVESTGEPGWYPQSQRLQ